MAWVAPDGASVGEAEEDMGVPEKGGGAGSVRPDDRRTQANNGAAPWQAPL